MTSAGYVRIEDVHEGEVVLSRNVDTGETGYKEVKQVFRNKTEILVRLIIGKERIETTPDHLFWIKGKGFLKASEIEVGDVVQLADNNIETVTGRIIKKLDTPVNVYNFEVADWHTYFVSRLEVLVHNDCSERIQIDNAQFGKSGTTRVGRWMSEAEYNKMVETGKVQMSPQGNTSYAANPADPNAFKGASSGSVYVEFDAPINSIYPAENERWGQISGPGSYWDRLNQGRGLPQNYRNSQ